MDETASYAASVVRTLSDHFPDLKDPGVAKHLTDWISRQSRDQIAGSEFIVDDPFSARWRLKPDSRDRRHVRLCYFPVIPPGSATDIELERAINDALASLVAALRPLRITLRQRECHTLVLHIDMTGRD